MGPLGSHTSSHLEELHMNKVCVTIPPGLLRLPVFVVFLFRVLSSVSLFALVAPLFVIAFSSVHSPATPRSLSLSCLPYGVVLCLDIPVRVFLQFIGIKTCFTFLRLLSVLGSFDIHPWHIRAANHTETRSCQSAELIMQHSVPKILRKQLQVDSPSHTHSQQRKMHLHQMSYYTLIHSLGWLFDLNLNSQIII